MFKRGIDKKALSEVIGYVLLIAISLSLAGMVYGWLTFYVNPSKIPVCEDSVSIAIRNYTYDCSNNSLSLTLHNNGLFNIGGYVVRVNNDSQRLKEIGVYFLDYYGKNLSIGEVNFTILPSNKTYKGEPVGGNLSYLEIQPYLIKDKKRVYCEAIAKHTLSC